MRSKIILGLGFVGLLAVAVGFYQFNRKVAGLENTAPDYSLTANDLFDAFDQDEAAAMALYQNKVIEVEGEIIEINNQNQKANIILQADNAMAGGINCSFNKEINHLAKGQTIKVKGRCQGFLMDVILNNGYVD